MKRQIDKILIIRFSSIGDIVLTTPVVRTLKRQLHAEIHFVTKDTYRTVLADNPYIDKIYTFEKKLEEILSPLKGENYDLIVDLHKSLRSRLLRLALRKNVISFDKINIKKWLFVNFKWNILPDKHLVDRYFDALSPLGIVNDGEGLDYFVNERDEVDVEKIYGIKTGQYLAFAIGGTYFTKKMPVEKIVEIVKKIKMPVVLLGGSEDKDVGKKIRQLAGNHVFNGCGKWKLNQSASIVRQAAMVITHDTGMMHIAAAFDKEIISIWGNTVPGFGMYPYLPEGKGRGRIVEVNGLSCRPCSKIGFDKCPKKHFHCMEKINVEEIIPYASNRAI